MKVIISLLDIKFKLTVRTAGSLLYLRSLFAANPS